jgi:hypothetical protein
MTLEAAARKTARCSVSSEGWLMIDTVVGAASWAGQVEFFERSSPPPKYVYGWTVQAEGEEPVHVTMLQSEKISSPAAAVHSWLATTGKA